MVIVNQIELIIDDVIGVLHRLVEYPEPFPSGSCIGVSAFLVPFIRLTLQTYECQVVVGHFDGKVHAWIECLDKRQDDCLIVDATVCQFDKTAPRVLARADAVRYASRIRLTRDQECDLRDHAEPSESGIRTRDGKMYFSALSEM